MFSLPQMKRCPCCESVNIVLLNGLTYDHDFKGLENHSLKKKFICRRCKEEIVLFRSNSNNNKTKDILLWLNDFKCEENYYDRLRLLKQKKIKLTKNSNTQKNKIKLKSNYDNKYSETLLEIDNIQKKIRMDKVKLRIKMKIQKRVTTINELS